jgi:hypothetical protein
MSAFVSRANLDLRGLPRFSIPASRFLSQNLQPPERIHGTRPFIPIAGDLTPERGDAESMGAWCVLCGSEAFEGGLNSAQIWQIRGRFLPELFIQQRSH